MYNRGGGQVSSAPVGFEKINGTEVVAAFSQQQELNELSTGCVAEVFLLFSNRALEWASFLLNDPWLTITTRTKKTQPNQTNFHLPPPKKQQQNQTN